MAKHPWLFRRGDRYYLRARVPADLIESFRKSEIKRSLGTADRREAERLIRVESAKVEREFEERRRSISVQSQPIEAVPQYALEGIVQEWLSEHMAATEAADKTFMASSEELAEWRLTAEQDVSELTESLARRDTTFVYSEAKKLLSSKNIASETDQKAFRKFCMLLLRARLEAAQRGLQELLTGSAVRSSDRDFVPEGLQDTGYALPPKRTNGNRNANSVTLGDLITRYDADPKRRALSPKTIVGYRPVRKVLQEVLTLEKPLEDISRGDCREVFKVLESLPVNASKLYPGMTAREWANIDGAKRISAKTLATHMGNLSALFKFAVDEGLIDRNPASNIYSIPKGAKGKRRPFSSDQLNRIFRHAPFDKPFSLREMQRADIKAHQFWAPLLALWTGMRANEILQLGTANIETVSGVDIIRVAFDETRGDIRLKSDGAVRVVPIHPELKKLGFPRFAEAQRKRGKTLLFPETKLDKHGYRSDEFSKWFARHLTSAKAKEAQTSFHSFRHNFRDALRNAGVPQERSRRLGGWAGDGGADEGYGAGFSPEELFKEICKISYQGVSLSHLTQRGLASD